LYTRALGTAASGNTQPSGIAGVLLDLLHWHPGSVILQSRAEALVFRDVIEKGLASWLARLMLEDRLDPLFSKIEETGVLKPEEAAKLKDDTRRRLEAVERDGLEYRRMADKALRDAVDLFFRMREGKAR
jgi:hypothetical protein